MKKNKTRITLLMAALMTLPGMYSSAQDVRSCDGRTKTHTLMINETNKVPMGVTLGNAPADDLYVCPGDTVAWILQGLGFEIDFPGGTPFNGNVHRATAGRVAMVVRSDVARGAAFKYNISIDGGGLLDPRIIVQD